MDRIQMEESAWPDRRTQRSLHRGQVGPLAGDRQDRRALGVDRGGDRARARRDARPTSIAPSPPRARRSTRARSRAGAPRSAPTRSAACPRRSRSAAPAIAEVISRENGCPARESIGTQVFAATMVLDIHADMAKSFNWVEERPGAFGNPVRVGRAAGRRVRGDHPVERAALHHGDEARPGARGRLHRGAEAVARDAARSLPARRGDPRGRAPARRDQHRGGGARDERVPREPPRHRQGQLHGQHRHRPARRVACGEGLKRCTLELGGKSAAILLDDFDLEAHAAPLLAAGLLNNGQACAAQTRILAPRTRYKEIVDALAAIVGAKKVGDALDPATEIGPLVAERQRDRVLGYLDAGEKAGARAVVRRRPSEGPDRAGSSSRRCSRTSTTR